MPEREQEQEHTNLIRHLPYSRQDQLESQSLPARNKQLSIAEVPSLAQVAECLGSLNAKNNPQIRKELSQMDQHEDVVLAYARLIGLKLEQRHIAWIMTGLAVALLLGVFAWSVRALNPKRSPASFRMKYTVALMSCLQWLIVPVPLMSKYAKEQVMGDVMLACYRWIPFWNIFCITDLFGAWVNMSWDMLWGTILGSMAMLPLNYIMPGGASCSQRKDCEYHANRGMMTYNCPAAILYSVLVMYLFAVSNTRLLYRMCAMCAFAGMFAQFCNPESDWKDMIPLFFGWDLSIHWKGYALIGIGTVICAFGLRWILQFSFPMHYFFGEDMSFSCFIRAKVLLQTYSQDCLFALYDVQRLWTEDTWSFEVHRCEKLLAGFKDQEDNLEMVLDYGWWEAYLHSHRETLRYQIWHKDLLQSIRLGLTTGVTFLKQCIDHSEDEAKFNNAMRPLLKQNLEELKEVMETLGNYRLSQEERVRRAQQVVNRDADVLAKILETLNQVRSQNNTSVEELSEQMAFATLVTSWKKTVQHAVGAFPGRPALERPSLGCLSYPRSLLTLARHRTAVKHALGFLVALWWVKTRRQWSIPVCCVSYCFLIQDETRLYDGLSRSRNRIIGTGAGLIATNVPITWLCVHLKYFIYVPQYLIIYYAIIALIWITASYGAMASQEMAGAYGLAAAMGSLEMMRPLEALTVGSASDSEGNAIRARHFKVMMDTFVALFVVLSFDLVFSYLFQDSAQIFASNQVSECLEWCAQTTDLLQQGKCPGEDEIRMFTVKLNNTKRRCEEAKEECAIWQVKWKSDISSTLLAECTTICTLLHTINLSMGDSSPSAAASKLGRLLPACTPSNFRFFAQSAQQALSLTSDCESWGIKAVGGGSSVGSFASDKMLTKLATAGMQFDHCVGDNEKLTEAAAGCTLQLCASFILISEQRVESALQNHRDAITEFELRFDHK